MGKYVIDKENLEGLNEWTCALYTLMHSLKTSRDRNFEPRDKLNDSGIEATKWIEEKNKFNSITHREVTTSKRKMKFRRDPAKNFEKTISRVSKMLIQDLVVLFDEILNDLMIEKGINVQRFPQSKVEALKKYIDSEYEWSVKGCMELIALRNAITHSKGKWNEKCLRILKDNDIINETEATKLKGKKVIVNIPMVFEYKKSIRTFMNQVMDD